MTQLESQQQHPIGLSRFLDSWLLAFDSNLANQIDQLSSQLENGHSFLFYSVGLKR